MGPSGTLCPGHAQDVGTGVSLLGGRPWDKGPVSLAVGTVAEGRHRNSPAVLLCPAPPGVDKIRGDMLESTSELGISHPNFPAPGVAGQV